MMNLRMIVNMQETGSVPLKWNFSEFVPHYSVGIGILLGGFQLFYSF